MALAIHPGTTTASITVDVVTSREALDSLKADWERLVDEMDVPSPFLSWHWNQTWWAHFGRRRPMRVAVLREDGEVVGIAPFYLYGFGPMRALVPFGWPDRLTEQIEPLVPGSGSDRLHAALNRWLLAGHPLGLVAGMALSSAESFKERAVLDDVFYEWRELPRTWDELLDGLNRSMRGNIRYYPRLLQRSGHAMAYREANDVAAVRAALPILFELHTSRANARGAELHRDRLKEPERRRFLHDLAGELAARGQMRVGLLQVDGKDVAAQLWFEWNGTMFLHYSGYEPSWSKFSVAMITTSEIIRQGVERGMKRVEFLRGAKQFKRRWNTEQRIQADVYFVQNPRLVPLFHRLRSLRRKIRSRTYRRPAPQAATEATAD